MSNFARGIASEIVLILALLAALAVAVIGRTLPGWYLGHAETLIGLLVAHRSIKNVGSFIASRKGGAKLQVTAAPSEGAS